MDHGSSALVAALIALGIGPEDEVIVPGLTWVACATAVLRVGATPVLVDIDPNTLCIDPDKIETAITDKTRAILAVHLYSAMANMDAIGRTASRHGLAVIEDASQAHGASWKGRGAGSIGDIGTFSMQQSKLLTSGEGGAVTTSSPGLRRMLEQIRGDGRRYAARPRPEGTPDLEDTGEIQGWNMHISEIQSALLISGLEQLPIQNERRSNAAAILNHHFEKMTGTDPARTYNENTIRTYYYYVLKIDQDEFAGRSATVISRALSAELKFWVRTLPIPLDKNRLYRPNMHWSARWPGRAAQLDPSRFDLGEAHRQVARSIIFHHPMLLAPDDQLYTIIEAVEKVKESAHLLPYDEE